MILSSDRCRDLRQVLPRRADPLLAALPSLLIHFGSAANRELAALPKKSCFLPEVVKNESRLVTVLPDASRRKACSYRVQN
ncbi:hypothetical protein RHECNPAF_730054 [Rhizobium etli CNPAF512]|nr:hypothetical protein RHECNPAF_730054 [Rhizobium etli CNPAF512]